MTNNQMNVTDLVNSVRDISEPFKLLIQQQPTLLSKIKIDDPVYGDNTGKVEWIEAQLTRKAWTVNGQSNAGATITLDSVAGLRVGDILRFQNSTTKADISNLLFLVTGINGLVVSGTRPYAGSTDTTIPDDANVYLVSRQGSDDDGEFDETLQGTVNYNYLQTFDTKFSIGLMAQNTQTYDRMNTIPAQELVAMERLSQEMNASLIAGRRVAASGRKSGSVGGLLDFATSKTAVSGALKKEHIDKAVLSIASEGINPANLSIICHPAQSEVISGFNANGLHVLRTENRTGYYVAEVQSAVQVGGAAPILKIVSDWIMPIDKVIIADLSKISIHPQHNLALKSVDATPPGARYEARRIHGTYTFKIQNASKTMHVLTGLTI